MNKYNDNRKHLGANEGIVEGSIQFTSVFRLGLIGYTEYGVLATTVEEVRDLEVELFENVTGSDDCLASVWVGINNDLKDTTMKLLTDVLLDRLLEEGN